MYVSPASVSLSRFLQTWGPDKLDGLGGLGVLQRRVLEGPQVPHLRQVWQPS